MFKFIETNYFNLDIVTKIPLTLSERIELDEELRVDATWEEFLELLPHVEYRIEYDGQSIVSFKGFGTPIHELLITNFTYLILSTLGFRSKYNVYSSNLAILNPDDPRKYFNGDCTVVEGEIEFVPLQGTMQAVSNPLIIVEVLSKSTRSYDLLVKLEKYRKIASLQQIFFIDSQKLKVDSYQRIEESTDWIIRTFDSADQVIGILDKGEIAMADLYQNVSFEDTSTQ